MVRFGVFGIIFSVALIVGAVIVMLVSPEIAEPLVCKANETIETRSFQQTDADGTGTVTNLYCVNNEGVARDVTPMLVIPFVAISIILPFFFSFFIAAGRRRQAREQLQTISGLSGGNLSGINLSGGNLSGINLSGVNNSSVDQIQKQFQNMPGVTVSSVEFTQPDQQDIDSILKGIGALKDQLKNIPDGQGVVVTTQSTHIDGNPHVEFSQPDQQGIDAMMKGIGALKDQLKNMSGGQGVVMSTQSTQSTHTEGDSLVDKLKQLQQAHTMGLISQEEFDATKKELLDKMTGNDE
jgi:hypothetical protein